MHLLALSGTNAHEHRTDPDDADQRPSTDPEADDKVDSPTDLDKRSWRYVLRKTVREFSEDQCTDLAAALTYYAVLALFPAAIALTSLLGLVGQGTEAVDEVLDVLGDVGAGGVVGRDRADAQGAQHVPVGRSRRWSSVCRRAVVGQRLRRSVRPRDEPGLRGRRGSSVLEAASGDAGC